MSVTNKLLVLSTLLTLAGCQTFGTAKPTPVVAPAPTPSINGAAISGGGIIGGEFGSALSTKDRQTALNAEYKSLEYGKANEAVDWIGDGGVVSGTVKAAQPYRVGSQDCRQYSHEISLSGTSKSVRGTACRNNDGSWSLLE
jgi:surface antigen